MIQDRVRFVRFLHRSSHKMHWQRIATCCLILLGPLRRMLLLDSGKRLRQMASSLPVKRPAKHATSLTGILQSTDITFCCFMGLKDTTFNQSALYTSFAHSKKTASQRTGRSCCLHAHSISAPKSSSCSRRWFLQPLHCPNSPPEVDRRQKVSLSSTGLT